MNPILGSRAPRPALSEHPAFPLMLVFALERFRCTLGEVREDYWLGRVWRALSGDPELAGRVARIGTGSVVITGQGFGAPPSDAREREAWRRYVERRVVADTGRPPLDWGVALGWSERPIEVKSVAVVSLLAQAVAGDERWGDLAPYARDLAPVIVPVACTVEGVVAA
jgi:hypothetical protein